MTASNPHQPLAERPSQGPTRLAVDIGSTHTAAALVNGGRVEVQTLDGRQAAPTVVAGLPDGLLFGSAAVAHRLVAPLDVALDFVRHVGQPVLFELAGISYPPEALVARYVQWVVEQVLGARVRPDELLIAHPPDWGDGERQQLTAALSDVGLVDVGMTSTLQAAVAELGATVRLVDGEHVLVCDVGGASLDVAVARAVGGGLAIVTQRPGVTGAAGLEFDQAVVEHVLGQVPREAVDAANTTTEGVAAIGRLRQSCVDAKEALSAVPAVDVPVALPDHSATVRLDRSEFDGLIGPMLDQGVEACRGTVADAGLDLGEISSILLVGGSAKVPALAEAFRSGTGIEVRADAHPELVVVRGAARLLDPSASVGTTVPPLPAGKKPKAGADKPGRAPGGLPVPLIGGGVAVVAAAAVAAFLFWPNGDDGGDDAEPGTGDDDEAVVDDDPCESPPSGTLIYTAQLDGGQDLFTVDVETGVSTNVTNSENPEGSPTWSPDGSQVAYQIRRDGGPWKIDIWDAAGESAAALTEGDSEDIDPSWSPDADRIVFTSNRSGNKELWTITTDGTRGLEQLTEDDGIDGNPAWSPDGSTIAFRSNREGDQFDLYLLDVESGEVEVVSRTTAPDDNDAVWSPDGDKLAATMDDDIVVIDLSSEDRPITFIETPAAVDDNPGWSPDGCWLSFTSDRAGDGTTSIFVMRSDGSDRDEPMQVTNSASVDDSAEWQPESGG